MPNWAALQALYVISYVGHSGCKLLAARRGLYVTRHAVLCVPAGHAMQYACGRIACACFKVSGVEGVGVEVWMSASGPS